MKKSLLMITIFFISFISCSRENEVLAELTNGTEKINILRKDLRLAIDLNQFEKKDITVALQNQILEELIFINVADIEYHLIKTPEMENQQKKSLILLDRKAFLNAMNYNLQNQVSDYKFKIILMQMLNLRKDRNLDRSKEAEDLLNQLNSAKNDSEIEKIITEKNENLRYRILGGYVDPYCLNCGLNPIADITEPLIEKKDNKFILIQNEQGYWIVRNLGIKEVQGNKLENIYEDYHKKTQFIARKFFENENNTKNFNKQEVEQLKQQILMDEKKISEFSKEITSHQIKMLKRNILMNHYNELKEKYGYKANKELFQKDVSLWDRNLELFEFNNKKYLLNDFFSTLEKENLKKEDFNKEELLMLIKQVYEISEVLKLSPYADKVEPIKEIFKSLILKQSNMNSYMMKEMEKIQVSEKEMLDYYDLRKNNEFKNQNFAQVKDRIKANLLNEKRQKAFQEIKQKLFEKYKVKIYKEKLKEGKV